MNYIYDVILNFSKVDDFRDFYEWDKNDNYIVVEKIPIFIVDNINMKKIYNHYLKIDDFFLEKIFQKTKINSEYCLTCCLVTDKERVVALKFENDGLVSEKSSLLLDEEEAVLEECSDVTLETIRYSILDKTIMNSFLTRRERNIQNSLIKELDHLYNLKIFDEIEYLYHEVFSDYKSVEEMYNTLVYEIKNCFREDFEKLYYITQMIPVEQYCKKV